MESKNIRYIPQLDHLRAFASILIVFYHGTQLIWHQLAYHEPFTPRYWSSHRLISDNPLLTVVLEGHTAVALFMVLSGFVFTAGAYKSEISYCKFLFNRLLRTYPLFMLLLVAGIFSFPENFHFNSFLQTVFALGNASEAIHAGSFSAMFWTNAVEWQFYLLFPFLLVILNRSGMRNLLGIMLVFMVIRGLAFLEGANIRDVSFWTIIGRMDQFLIGMCVAVLYKEGAFAKYKKIIPALFAVVSLFIISGLFWLNHNGGWVAISWWKMFMPVVEGALWGFFIIFYLSLAGVMPAMLSRILCTIGKVSYSIYLLHFIIIQIIIKHGLLIPISQQHLLFSALVNAMAVIFPVTLALSMVTYTFIEKPFLDMRVVYKKS